MNKYEFNKAMDNLERRLELKVYFGRKLENQELQQNFTPTLLDCLLKREKTNRSNPLYIPLSRSHSF